MGSRLSGEPDELGSWATCDLQAELACRGVPLLLEQHSSEALLSELVKRGGTLRACAEAQLLCLRKSQDYNQTGGNAGTFNASRDDYFPFGLSSYAQMIHTKSQRLISLAKKGKASNFESAMDTALDLINYASFLADWLDRMDTATHSGAQA